jgi:excisionase family DNA binding protein
MTGQLNPVAAVQAGQETPAQVNSATAVHECMSANELAAYLRVNRKTVYEYAARNVIPCRRLGRRIVFSRGAILTWLARSSTAPRAA